MKKIILTSIVGLVLGSNTLFAQVWIEKAGTISFYSSTPVEDISAKNTQVSSALNTATGDVVVKLNIKDFVFPVALMQEHFNENYLESSKYPTSTFKGKIIETIDYTKNGSYPVTATGKLNIHGVEKDKTINGTLKIENGKITLDAAFDILLEEYKIERPSIVMMKIAEKIAVKALFVYLPKK